MISRLRGPLLEKGPDHVVVEAGGVGYEVLVSPSAAARLPAPGAEVELFVSESVGMYGGGVTLYGFPTAEERRLFLTFRELPSVGAKKALEYLEKASKSLPDFRRAILDGDARMLTTLFGFTRKTADRLLAGLKDVLGAPVPSGAARARADAPSQGSNLSRAIDALAALGYRAPECRAAIEEVQRSLAGREASVEELIRLALKKL